jgi:hypothetical protein
VSTIIKFHKITQESVKKSVEVRFAVEVHLKSEVMMSFSSFHFGFVGKAFGSFHEVRVPVLYVSTNISRVF